MVIGCRIEKRKSFYVVPVESFMIDMIDITMPPGTDMTNSKVLHETVQMNFNKTPGGKIYEEDLKNIYCALICGLNLNDNNDNKGRFNPLGRKLYLYSFTIEQALNTMKTLRLEVRLPRTTSTIFYKIKPDLGLALLRKFYDAKLLHSPADRTRSEPKKNVALQPTPKGVAMLQDFCYNIGMKGDQLPLILKSSFNSMELIKFDRDVITDKILYSDYFIHLLFIKMMGDERVIWTSSNAPDELPSLDVKTDLEESFGFDIGFREIETFVSLRGFDIARQESSTNSSINNLADSKPIEKETVSPFYHRYFTNPESDSHIQYYVSKGVRFHKDIAFKRDGEEIVLSYCLTGKSICQWLSDCTDIFSPNHAVEIASLLLKSKLLVPVMISPSISNLERVVNSRNAYYALSTMGENSVNWKRFGLNSSEDDLSNKFLDEFNCEKLTPLNEDSFDVTEDPPDHPPPYSDKASSVVLLKEVLRDPGMRYLFKQHLKQEFCSENLEAYLKLKQYERQTVLLGKLLRTKKYGFHKGSENKLNKQIVKLTTICLSSAFHIYFTYISNDSPFVINIDYSLRERITSIMMFSNVSPSSAIPLEVDTSSPDCQNYTLEPLKHNRKIMLRPDPPLLSSRGLKLKDVQEVTEPSVSISSDLEVRRQDATYNLHQEGPMSPTEVKITNNLDTLLQISSIFQDIIKHIYRLMEVDSFPKFLDGSLYQNANANIELTKR
ncbi:uncharacterized protein PRCAT00002253001 [Priceomyces carsonii]|uniref:uncharacterized protein n=1 Tax=Priceomyces carsonii TaxID=28549 RepID=UPI002ED959FE|nr:unnamed protein product [Priceomyces carsonii]